jgi:RHS repeat-associated protein
LKPSIIDALSTPNLGKTLFYYDNYKYLNKVTDRRGNSTLYTNEVILGNPKRITYPGPTTPHVDYTYSNNLYPYHVATVTDELGYKTTYQRDGLSRIYEIDYPDGATETFAYNGFGQVITHQRKNGAYEYADYDGRGLLKTLWNPTTSTARPTSSSTLGRTTFSYYPTTHVWADRVQTMTDPRGYRTTYEYDHHVSTGAQCPGRGLITKISYPDDKHIDSAHPNGLYPNGTSQVFTYDVYGNKLSETNELGQRTTYSYDDYNRLIGMKLPPTAQVSDSTTVYDYSATDGTPYSHTTKSWRWKTTAANTSSHVITENLYDPNFRLSTKTESYGSLNARTYYGYDANGNQTSVVDPRGSGADDLNYTTTTEYDLRNRKTKTTSPQAADGQIQITQWGYDDAGNVTSITRPDTKVETKTYDEMHRVLNHTVPKDASPATFLTTTFTYYPSGTLHTETDPKGQMTTFVYQASDLKARMYYPGNAEFEGWIYDEAKNVTARYTVDPTIIQTFGYDSRNRKSSMRLGKRAGSTNTVDSANTYDWSNFAYDGAGRLTSGDNWISTVTRGYDEAGRLLGDTQTFKNVADTFGSKQVQYYYNPDNKVARLVIPPGNYTYLFSYDDMGRFEKINYLPNNDFGAYYYYIYDAASNVAQRINRTNATAVVYYHDKINRLMQRDINVPTAQISRGWYSREHYGFDAMNRLTSVKRDEDNLLDTFRYNLADEITTAWYGWSWNGSAWVNPAWSQGYSWDDAGNRSMAGYSVNNLNQYTQASAKTVTNNNEHQIAAYNSVGYGYYGDTYLSSAAWGGIVYRYYYDALGRCVVRTVTANNVTTNNYYLFDGEHWVMEYDATGKEVGNAVYGLGIDEIIARANNGQAQFPMPDRNGNTSVILGASGQVLEQYRYDAFGTPTIRNAAGTAVGSSQIKNHFMFTGRELNPQLAFYEFRARAYHPGLGRFMSEDPKGFDAGDYNLFRYCENDPWDKTDPMGLSADQRGPPPPPPPPKERLVREITRTVTGSLIPLRIRYTESGNWTNRSIASHYSGDLESRTGNAGSTLGKANVNNSGSNVSINLHVDWFVDSKYRDTDVVTRELQHVQGFRDLSKGIDASLSSSGLSTGYLNGLPARVVNFSHLQQLEYDWPPNSGKPHDLLAHPPVPATLPENENTH